MKVEEYFTKLPESLASVGYILEEIAKMKARSILEGLVVLDYLPESQMNIPMIYSGLKDKHFPLFLTFDRLTKMIAADILYKKYSAGTFLNVDNADAHDCFVTYDVFANQYWPRFPQNLSKNLNSWLVFNEFMRIVKGSEYALTYPEGALDRPNYLRLPHRFNPNFANQRGILYDIFEYYTKIKRQRRHHDVADRTHVVLKLLRSQRFPGQQFDYLYVDETRNLDGLFWAGDTTQTIFAGVPLDAVVDLSRGRTVLNGVGGHGHAPNFDYDEARYAGACSEALHDLIYIANVTLGGIGDSSINLIVWSNLTQALLTYESLTFQHPSPIQTLCPRTVIWLMVLVGYMVVFPMSMPSLLAFLDVSSAQNPALSHGASGLLGLGFDSLSTIGALVNATGASTGRSLLYHLFQDNPSEPNFIALSLRTSQLARLSLNIPMSQAPTKSNLAGRLSNALECVIRPFIVRAETCSVSTGVQGAPSNKAVVLLDSGTPYTYAPTDVCEAIYSGVSGAQYNSDLGQCTVPYDAEIDMAKNGLTMAFFYGYCGDQCNFRAFLAGVVVLREGAVAISLTKRLEDLQTIVFLPLYFTLSGMNDDLGLLNNCTA
ncbi:hypothetical protein BD769DRAFT_1681205 [Suillus cothurnatus]|nr:hypothetical protein BD769DRAFT_1681205 [Suillus cothurnatus]